MDLYRIDHLGRERNHQLIAVICQLKMDTRPFTMIHDQCFPLSNRLDDRDFTGFATSLFKYFQWMVNGVHGKSGPRAVRRVAGENSHGSATVIIHLGPGMVPTVPGSTKISSPATISPVLVSFRHPEHPIKYNVSYFIDRTRPSSLL